MRILLLILGGVIGLAAIGGILGAVGFSIFTFGQVAWNAVRRPSQIPIILRIAFRNIFASRVKTAVIGAIIGGGALLIVVGSSFINSISHAMSQSIIGGATGDLQIYAPKLPNGGGDELAIWTFNGADQDLGSIPDFAKLKATVEQVDNVKSVVPMGIASAMVGSGNTTDLALQDLRELENKRIAGDQSVLPRIVAQKAHIEHILQVLQGNQKNSVELSGNERGTSQDEIDAVNAAASPAFWADFDKDPLNKLEFLENKIAPQTADAAIITMRYLGTDMAQFQHSFNRMEIVDGTTIPEGQRGFLFAKNFYETNMKLKNAKRLDDLNEAIVTNHQKIAKQDDLRRLVRENMAQTREIALQLDDLKAQEMVARLQRDMGSSETGVEPLLRTFFQTNDDNFKERYQQFYRDIAPLIDLYRVRVGDRLTIKAFTKNGYAKSVSLKVYGTFQFTGLEKSTLAGSLNLMDLQSFRSLYGFMTPDKVAESTAIEKQAGAVNYDRDHAEQDIFGSGSSANSEALTKPSEINPNGFGNAASVSAQSDINQGGVLNAAVFLKDPTQTDKTLAAIQEATKKAGMNVRVIPWLKASGMVGMIVVMVWAGFAAFTMIFAFIALIIVNIALLTSTLERVREFGTLRAMGAQKPLVLSTVMAEAIVTGTVFGGIGAAVGAVIVLVIHAKGIAATQDIMYFLFSGPRFAPDVNVPSLIVAVLAMVVVSAIACVIPAFLATRVSPVRAMQTEN